MTRTNVTAGVVAIRCSARTGMTIQLALFMVMMWRRTTMSPTVEETKALACRARRMSIAIDIDRPADQPDDEWQIDCHHALNAVRAAVEGINRRGDAAAIIVEWHWSDVCPDV